MTKFELIAGGGLRAFDRDLRLEGEKKSFTGNVRIW